MVIQSVALVESMIHSADPSGLIVQNLLPLQGTSTYLSSNAAVLRTL